MGTLYVVGIGPGAADLVTPRARRALEQADVILGYARYLDLVREWLPHGPFRPSPIGEEAARTEEALRLAAGRERVALVCSGDAGVYGLAGLAHELRAALDWADAAPPDIEVVPGVTAATAAAALLGAPLGHDFAAISLSDLLTPWEVILHRLEAVAQSGFVIALYNPASESRRHRFEEACAVLLRHRAPDTAVGIVTNAGRAGERVDLTTLGLLNGHLVGMLSTVIVGSPQTIVQQGRMVTPRGYAVPPAREQSACSSERTPTPRRNEPARDRPFLLTAVWVRS